MGFLAGKRLLITGVLNNRSLAYGIASACHREGAELAFSYQGERFKDRIAETAADSARSSTFDCDVAEDAQIERLFASSASMGRFDGFVHAIAFAPREAIAGDFLEGLSPRGLPHRARDLGLQLPGDGQGGPARACAPGARC